MIQDYNEDVATVTSVHFGVLSPERMRQLSVCEIYRPIGSQTLEGTLMDKRLGPIDKGVDCPICKEGYKKCAGHYGHIELPYPIITPQFYQTIIKIANLYCHKCSSFLYPKYEEGTENITDIYKNILMRKGISRQQYVTTKLAKKNICYRCEAVQPSFIKDKDSVLGVAKKFVTGKKTEAVQQQQFPVSNFEIYNMFKRISDEEASLFGFNPKLTRPDWLLMVVILVPPTAMRPSVSSDSGKVSADDLVHKMNEIIKTINMIRAVEKEQVSGSALLKNYELLQYHVTTYIDNNITTVKKATHRSGRPIKAIRQRIGGKEGRFRSGLMGKRVDLSGRTVITPNPDLSIDQLGLPKEIAMNLPYPELVTKYNINHLTELVHRGADNYPGAKSVLLKGKKYSLASVAFKTEESRKERLKLSYGDTVYRHLMDGDWVLFNRQPTLHRMGMMGHRVKIHDGRSFQFNPTVCKPYAADFDGDEMNIHVPISAQTVAEIRFIASVPTQIVSPQKHEPIIGFVQDSILGCYKLSKEGTEISIEKVMRLLSRIRNYTGKIPEPAGQNAGGAYWTAQQIITMILPFITYDNGSVSIKGGIMNKGIINKKIVGATKNSIFHAVWNDLGSLATRDLMDELSALANQWLLITGFSCGVDDCETTVEQREHINNIIAVYIGISNELIALIKQGIFINSKKFREIISKYEVEGITSKEDLTTISKVADLNMQNLTVELERNLIIIADACRSKVEVFMVSTKGVTSNNRIKIMADAGSKGDSKNLQDFIGILALQTIESKWITNDFYRRPSPHVPKDTLSLFHHGFVQNSYSTGLSSDEYYNHAAAGRDGVISKGIKTAETGYIQRKFTKALESVHSSFDGTIRNENGLIVQFIYGNDGFDATYHEHQKIKFLSMDRYTLLSTYKFVKEESSHYMTETDDTAEESSEQEINQIIEYQMYLKEKIFKGKKLPDTVLCPVNFARLTETVAYKFANTGKTNLTCTYVVLQVQKLREKIAVDLPTVNEKFGVNYRSTILFNSLLATNVYSRKLINDYRYTCEALDYLLALIYEKFLRALLNPKENVGIISSQSLGEPTSQLSLSAIHKLGGTASAELLSGVPRLKEILSISKNTKTPSLNITINEKYITLEKFSSVKEAIEEKYRLTEKIASKILHTTFKHIVTKASIIYDVDGKTIKEDQDIINSYYKIDKNMKYPEEGTWIIRFEFDREVMAERYITMIDISQILNDILSDANLSEGSKNMVWVSNDNSKILLSRITISHDSSFDKNPLSKLKTIQQLILNSTIKGIEGITKCNVITTKRDIVLESGEVITTFDDEKYSKYKDQYEHLDYTITTLGSNLKLISNLPEVDSYNTISNNIWEMYEIYGIECARACLINELNMIMDQQGVASRHTELLVSLMTNASILTSIDRYGLSKSDSSVLARSSFEEAVSQITKATLFSESDLMQSVSSTLMFAQLAKSATGSCKLALDTAKLKTLTEVPVRDPINEATINVSEVKRLLENPCHDSLFDFEFKFE